MGITGGFFEGATRINRLGVGRPINLSKIVIHYTAGSSLSGAVNTLENRDLSYNLLIDTDGSIHQARAIGHSAGHAGRSNWKAQSGLENGSSLNGHSVGISLVSLGLFDFFRHGKYWYGFRNGQVSGPSIDDVDANKMASIYAPNRISHWSEYTNEQIEACRTLIGDILLAHPEIDEIVGHDDISIGSKYDPGPSFPLADFRDEFNANGSLGLRAQVNSPDGELNLRDRPQYLDGKRIETLHQGDEVFIRSVAYTSRRSAAALIAPSSGRALSSWASVDIDGSNRHAGFVHMRYLSATPLAAAYAGQL